MRLSEQQLETLRQTPCGETGNRVGLAIELLGLTQDAVAAGTGFSQPYVSAVVRGRFDTLTIENGYVFAEYFGCSIEDLVPRRHAAQPTAVAS